jgi:hypothetical protein
MNRKSDYVDMNKFVKTRRRQKARYRNKNGANMYERKIWTDYEDYLVLKHDIPDTRLSIIIERSVGAIQTRRVKLKKLKDLKNSVPKMYKVITRIHGKESTRTFDDRNTAYSAVVEFFNTYDREFYCVGDNDSKTSYCAYDYPIMSASIIEEVR